MKNALLLIAFLVITIKSAVVREEVWTNASLKGGKTEVLLFMNKQMDFGKLLSKNRISVYEMKDETERGYLVMNALQEQARSTQKSTIEYLKKNNLKFESFWVSNVIAVSDVSEKQIRELSQISDIKFVNSNKPFNDLDQIEEPVKEDSKNAPQEIEFNIKHIGGDKVWAMGYKGSGMVTGVIDTGIQHDHPALIGSYRGNKNGRVTHDFNWLDGDRGVRVPTDTNGHGTHCTGTVCGGDARKIGVAPDAKWIHCRAISGASQASKYLKCYQFFMAPHDLNGNNADPSLRPHTTSHSYGCGGCRPDDLEAAFEAMEASGIFLSVSSGNSGPRCSTVNRPPGFYASAFAVGALNKSPAGTIARFSSRGPATYDRSNRLKPEISAPGVSVVSSWLNRGYRALSGTSMASPAVNGAVALLWDAVPQLKRRIGETIKLLQATARGQTSTLCGVSGSPNNEYGYGGIDIYAAVKRGKSLYQENEIAK